MMENVYILGNKKKPVINGLFYAFICISLLFVPYYVVY